MEGTCRRGGGGGSAGRPLELLFADDKGDPGRGVEAAEDLLDRQDVVMLGGGYGSAVTEALAELAQRRRVPFLVTTGAADAITEQERDCPGSRDRRNVSLVSGVYKLIEDFGRGSPAEGLAGSAVEGERDRGEVVAGVSDKVGAAGFTLPAFYELTGDDAEQVMTVTLWHPSLPYPGAREFFTRFERKFGRATDYHGAEAYSAGLVIADALARATSSAPEALRDALEATDLETPFGPVRFVSEGGKTNQNRLPTYVGQWLDGQLELVWPPAAAGAEYVLPPPRHR